MIDCRSELLFRTVFYFSALRKYNYYFQNISNIGVGEKVP